jgi:hypothetical protein
MKINYAILGSDTNPLYLDFWPIISQIWKQEFNIIPILGLICNEDSDIYEDEYGLIKKFKSIEGINPGLQSQIIRLYLPKLLQGTCLLSDIDMMPLSRAYFIDNLLPIGNESLAILSADNPECLKDNQFPICYVAGNAEVYQNVFNLTNTTWEEFARLLHNRNEGWFTDQRYLYDTVLEYANNGGKVEFFSRGWTYGPADNRIDRLNWYYDKEAVTNGYYIDSHLLRPFNQYKNEVLKLYELLRRKSI